jgi:hypothetical protein
MGRSGRVAIPASSVLRAATTSRRSSCFASLSFGSAVPLPVALARPLGNGEISQVPGGASPVAYAAFSDPGRAFVPCLGGRPAGRGVAGAGDFRLRLLACRCLIPSHTSLSRRLAARRYSPRSRSRRGPRRYVKFRGSITRPQRSLSTLRSTPRDVPRKTRLQPVANLYCAGLSPARLLSKFQLLHL